MVFGTHMTWDTLAVSDATIAELGEDVVFRTLNLTLAAHNLLMQEKARELIGTRSPEARKAGPGAAPTVQMEELDELGTPEAQKVTVVGAEIGFPLRRYGVGVQWSRHYFQNATGRDLAKTFTAIRDADARNFDLQMRKAIFRATNYTVKDRLVDWTDINAKAFINADSTFVPHGQAFTPIDGSTHTHFLADATFDNDSAHALVDTVLEHYNFGSIRIYINRADQAAWEALADYEPLVRPGVILGQGDLDLGRRLDIGTMYDKMIGDFNGAEVWIKPWIPASYAFAFNTAAPKPLRYRTRRTGGGNLVLEAELEVHPLRAQAFAREFGMSVEERTNGAILYTGGGSYVVPTLT